MPYMAQSLINGNTLAKAAYFVNGLKLPLKYGH